MNLIVTKMKWIMVIIGALTCTMFYATIAPQAALLQNFGASINGPVAEIVVRNWGALIGLIGVLVIYAAYVPIYRRLVLTLAIVSKSIFISLILIHGQTFLPVAAPALVFDTIAILIFAAYLLATRENSTL